MKHIKHMKLGDGTEIVADIVEWPTEEEHSFVIKNVYEIHCVDNELTGRFFQFRTWMVYQDQQQLQVLNPDFVMAEANPTQELLKHYYNAIEAKELTDEELAQRMKEISGFKITHEDEEITEEKDTDNIVPFPGKTVH